MDVSDGEFFQKLIASPRPSRIVEFPRPSLSGTQLAIVVLTQGEIMQANAQAERKTRAALKDDVPRADQARQGYDELFQLKASTELVFRACKRADDITKPFFRTPDDIDEYLTVDEIASLYAYYLDLVRDVSPIQSIDSDDGFEAWCARVVKGGSMHPLALLSLEAQSGLVKYLMRQIWPSLNANT